MLGCKSTGGVDHAAFATLGVNVRSLVCVLLVGFLLNGFATEQRARELTPRVIEAYEAYEAANAVADLTSAQEAAEQAYLYAIEDGLAPDVTSALATNVIAIAQTLGGNAVSYEAVAELARQQYTAGEVEEAIETLSAGISSARISGHTIVREQMSKRIAEILITQPSQTASNWANRLAYAATSANLATPNLPSAPVDDWDNREWLAFAEAEHYRLGAALRNAEANGDSRLSTGLFEDVLEALDTLPSQYSSVEHVNALFDLANRALILGGASDDAQMARFPEALLQPWCEYLAEQSPVSNRPSEAAFPGRSARRGHGAVVVTDLTIPAAGGRAQVNQMTVTAIRRGGFEAAVRESIDQFHFRAQCDDMAEPHQARILTVLGVWRPDNQGVVRRSALLASVQYYPLDPATEQ